MQTPKLIAAAVLVVASFAANADSGDVQYRFLDQQASTLTRDQVRKEAADAIARGELLRERHVFAAETSTRSRAEVIAEMREAHRLGLLFDTTPRLGTPEQEAQIRAAGQAAARALAEGPRKSPG